MSEMDKQSNLKIIKEALGCMGQECYRQDCQSILNVITNPDVFRLLIKMSEAQIHAESIKYDVIVSMGEVGILLGSAIAQKFRKPFIPIMRSESEYITDLS